MTAAAVSGLVEYVLDLHRHHQDPTKLTIITVLQVAGGAGANDIEALELGLRDADGATIKAADNTAGARGQMDDDLSQLLQEVFATHGRDDLQIDQSGDAIVASTTTGVTAASASEGQRTLFGVLASLFDARLHGSELAALVYDESELDSPTANMLWSLCAVHLRNIAWPNLKTLVVVVRSGGVVPERHFGGQASALCVLNGDSLDVRRSPETDKIDVRRIAHGRDRLVLFLAAGFSTSSKTDDDQPLPLGNELRDRALQRLMSSAASGDELARRFLRYCKERHTLLPGERHLTESAFAAGLTLERVLVEELHDPPRELGPTLSHFKSEVEQAHSRSGIALEALHEFLAKTSRRVVLATVNLDDLIERQCGADVAPIISDDDFEDAPARIAEYWENDGASPLLKLHGSLEQPETVVASVNSVALGLSDQKIAALDAALIAPNGERTTVCYVGSSMRDRDINQLLGLRRYAECLDEWWIAPTIAQSVREFIETYRHRRWQVAQVESSPEAHCVTQIADDFFSVLAHES